MNYLLDLIILAIISISTFSSYKKGLIKVAFGLISFILALALSIILYKPVSNFIVKYTPVDDHIENIVSGRLTSSEITEEETQSIISNYFKNIKNASSIVIADSISKTIINISSMIIVFILSNIILLFFKFIGDLIAKIPLIKELNHAGGFLYGIIKGFFIIYVILALITIISPIVNMSSIVTMINNSIIAKIMYSNNILLILFG